MVPNEKSHRKAVKYLSEKVKIVRYNEVEKFVATSLEKVPNKERFLRKKKSMRGAGYAFQTSPLPVLRDIWTQRRGGEELSPNGLLLSTPSRSTLKPLAVSDPNPCAS